MLSHETRSCGYPVTLSRLTAHSKFLSFELHFPRNHVQVVFRQCSCSPGEWQELVGFFPWHLEPVECGISPVRAGCS